MKHASFLTKIIINLVAFAVIGTMTFGIFYLFINGFMVWLTSTLVRGFIIADFATAFWAAIFLSLISWLAEMIFFKRDV
jgi:uncharacterized membrane protein YvlD (DUF360 family)